MSIRILHGDCREVLRTLPDAAFAACVTDAPYELGFMGKGWDRTGIANNVDMWAEVLRVLKPGAHLAAFGGTRTFHRMACAIEDAGFEIRDTLMWIYASGFPKSLDVSKAIDKAAGVERAVVGSKFGLPGYRTGPTGDNAVYGDGLANGDAKCAITAPATPEAAQWSGWGTALKPSFEPIILARKPLAGTVASNVLAHGCGALNIDACRVPCDDKTPFPVGANSSDGSIKTGLHNKPRPGDGHISARWPANVMHDGSPEVEAAFAAFGERPGAVSNGRKQDTAVNCYGDFGAQSQAPGRADTGTASRFFLTAKADASDRAGSKHPTVKPTALMRWLVQLVTPPGGAVLDPFAGSGSTGLAADQLGFDATLIEQDAEYVADIRRKIVGDAPLFAEVL